MISNYRIYSHVDLYGNDIADKLLKHRFVHLTPSSFLFFIIHLSRIILFEKVTNHQSIQGDLIASGASGIRSKVLLMITSSACLSKRTANFSTPSPRSSRLFRTYFGFKLPRQLIQHHLVDPLSCGYL